MEWPGVSERRSGTSKFYHQDQLGTVTRLTDSSQATSATKTYDAFGTLVASTGSTPTPFGLVGGEGYQGDIDSGLMLLGHRYYDSSTGRFVSRDPVSNGRNWYAYCDSSATNEVDPAGCAGVPPQNGPGNPKPGGPDFGKPGNGTGDFHLDISADTKTMKIAVTDGTASFGVSWPWGGWVKKLNISLGGRAAGFSFDGHIDVGRKGPPSVGIGINFTLKFSTSPSQDSGPHTVR